VHCTSFCAFLGLATMNIFSSVNKVMLTSKDEYFLSAHADGQSVDISFTACFFVCLYGYGFLRRGYSYSSVRFCKYVNFFDLQCSLRSVTSQCFTQRIDISIRPM